MSAEESIQIGHSETTEHRFYVAHCAECGQRADGDGAEYAESPAEAVEYVLDVHEWVREDDGRLICDECRGDAL